MSIQQPAWLKRTRPCPFYSQGRCLFADSCNFLHDVKVRNPLSHPLPSTSQVKQPSVRPKPVFDLPSVVVDSASPLVNPASPESLASPVQDSSRYSGLLSVLSDIIGPPSTAEDAIRATSANPLSLQSTAYGPGLLSEPSLVGSGFDATNDTVHSETGSPGCLDLSSIHFDSEATLVSPSGYQNESYFPEEDDEPVAEFLPVPDDADGGATSYFVEDAETYAIGSESSSDDDTDHHGEEDFTVVMSNRQSTLSSFTGVSLLASPRNNVFGVPSSVGDGVMDLLSPVELSAKLRPFSIPSLGSRIRRGDSIDSGYADGENWVGPLPFPCSPPTSFRSPVTFLSHSRQTSHSFSALKDNRGSYDAGTVRLSSHNPIEGIKEVESDGCFEHGSEDNEEAACIILDAYDKSPFEERGEDKARDPLQVKLTVVTEDNVKDPPPEVPAVMCSLQRYSPEHLHPRGEYDVDSCNQPSFVSDDDLSFKTALSAQPSYDDLSDVSRVAPVKQNSLLPSISGCSTPNTSVLSHYSDANESSGRLVVSSDVYKSSSLLATSLKSHFDNTGVLDAKASEESSLPAMNVMDSNVIFASAGANEHSPGKVVTLQESLPAVFHFNRRTPTPSATDISRSPSSEGNHAHRADDIQESAAQKVTTPQECVPGASQPDKNPPSLSRSETAHSPLLVTETSNFVCLDADDPRGISSQNDIAPRQQLPSPWDHDRDSPTANSPTEGTSCGGVLDFAPAVTGEVQRVDPDHVMLPRERSPHVLGFNECSARLSSAGEIPRSPSMVENVLSRASQGTGGRHNTLPVNVGTHSEHRTGDFHFNEHLRKLSPSAESFHSPSLVQDVLGRANGVQENDTMEYASGVSGLDRPFPRSAALAESLRNLSPAKGLGNIPAGVNSGESVYIARRATTSHADQSLTIENCLGPNETIKCLDSECEKITQRLSFPPPPPFLPAEFVGHSTLNDDNSSVLSEATVIDLEGDGSKACTMSQQEEVLRSGSDRTEKMWPSRLPPFGSPDSNADFTSRRSRAASDLTVKGKSSPATIPEDVLKSPSLALDRVDPVNSFYDQYIDDGTLDDCRTHKTTPPPDISSTLEDPQCRDLTFQRGPSPCSNRERSNSGVDSPRSETVLRPLLTGRRSFLCSSLAELVPKAHPDSVKGTSSTRPSTRLETREIGSTMVPLGFRRYKPQPVPQAQSLPLHTVLPASQLREVLRIRTDLPQEVLPQGCSSATHVSFVARSPLPAQSMSAPPTGGLKQLRLSSVINKRSSMLSTHSSSIASSILSYHLFNSFTPQSPSVSSTTSFSRHSLLSSSCKQIPEQTHHTLQRSLSNSPILQAAADPSFAPQLSSTCHDLRSVSAPVQQSKSWRLSHYRAGSRNYSPVDNTRRLSRRTSILSLSYAVDEEQEIDEDGPTISQSSQSNHADGWTHPVPILAVHAIATPKPTLLFAIASDDVDQVRQVLESGDAGPNDSVGPQSALAFTLTNDKLTHKPEIVKALLAYGANPSALRNPTLNPAPHTHRANEPSAPPPETTLEGMDPATRYFVARADTAHTRQTSQLIYRSFFRPLTRVRYDVIGQDWALEQLFRVLSMHSQKLAVAPIVVLLCGPSGHGKSLLARKFGFLLDVPTHTVNMTTLQSAHDIWQSYSMSPYEEPSSCTLAEFLIENEGKRCVVVLDEIEKVEDQKALWSLLMPWELGRCSLEAGKRHVDARNVIWLATSNVGHELVFEYHEKRAEPDSRMSREDYVELTAMLRPRVSHCLGASLVSRVTKVLPFVPFTLDEKEAIAAEAIYAFVGEASKMSPQEVESLVMKALPSYHPSEGARSLHRAISNILMDTV